ncbi:MAG: GNAT family N-acetyltransferase [Candidatus Dormibacteraeota bacterium]|nr:GNAT family N-acetyltransferase [Candidatus Dormibacteraeota bacterium]
MCDDPSVRTTIRRYRSADEESVLDFALRAWAPVFASLEAELGSELFARLHHGEDGWRGHQQAAIRRTLADASMVSWVAERGPAVVGFVSSRLTDDPEVGEIYMLAVDPDHQAHGVGTRLTETATNWLRRSGARVAMVETGGDPGHSAARRTYEKAAYRLLPVARYFKAL